MLERFLGEQTAKDVEAGLILVSLYDAVMSAYSSLSKLERIIEVFAPLLIDGFSGELKDLMEEFGSAVLQLAKVNWKNWEEIKSFKGSGGLDSYKAIFKGIAERAELLRKRVTDELMISTSVLAAAVERSEGNDLVLRFLAARIREIPLKAEYVADNYLEILLSVLSEYVSSREEDVLPIVRTIGEIRRGIVELEKSKTMADELRGLVRLLDYAKHHAYNLRFLIPGLLKYLKEIKEEILPQAIEQE